MYIYISIQKFKTDHCHGTRERKSEHSQSNTRTKQISRSEASQFSWSKTKTRALNNVRYILRLMGSFSTSASKSKPAMLIRPTLTAHLGIRWYICTSNTRGGLQCFGTKKRFSNDSTEQWPQNKLLFILSTKQCIIMFHGFSSCIFTFAYHSNRSLVWNHGMGTWIKQKNREEYQHIIFWKLDLQGKGTIVNYKLRISF